MTETYYNAITDGIGIEGFLNWANLTVDGWMASMFLFFIWLSLFMLEVNQNGVIWGNGL